MEILDSALSVFMKIGFRFEIFYPHAIKLFLNQKLKEFKNQKKLNDYKVKAKRLGKNHYFFEMDIFLNANKGGGDKNIRNKKGTHKNNH
ncbi:MAG: hypothetical protein NUK62_08725 [Tenericutes bacterium]|nr:hypothetical protein [Mycoplasmatota bacterium]